VHAALAEDPGDDLNDVVYVEVHLRAVARQDNCRKQNAKSKLKISTRTPHSNLAKEGIMIRLHTQRQNRDGHRQRHERLPAILVRQIPDNRSHHESTQPCDLHPYAKLAM
jgi:hypothetical protein